MEGRKIEKKGKEKKRIGKIRIGWRTARRERIRKV